MENVAPSLSVLMRNKIALLAPVVLSAVLAGCASSPSQVAWSHAMSGEYLFAYDQSSCESAAGNAAADEFFTCMEALGYYRVDPQTRIPLDSGTQPQVADTDLRATSAAR